MKTISRRQFLLSLLGAGVGALGYGTLIEPHWLQITRRRVPLTVAVGARIGLLHLSDLHASAVVPFSHIERAIDTGLLHRPDLICLTGDFITDQIPEAARYARILRRLSDFAPTFACLGNHDGGKWARRRGGYATTTAVEQLLAESGIQCLVNESAWLSVRGIPLRITGLGDWWAGRMQPALAFGNASESPDEPVVCHKLGKNKPRPGMTGGPAGPPAADRGNAGQVLTARHDPLPAPIRIVLSHNPDTKKFIARQQWDLLLCGHTHGGQIRIPLAGAPFAPVRDRRFIEGLHLWRGRWLHITRGVGNVRGVRINCRPEVSLLDLGNPLPPP